MKSLWLSHGLRLKLLSKEAKLFSMKSILIMVIICCMLYLVYSFPDYSILIISIGLIILIGYWLLEAYGEE